YRDAVLPFVESLVEFDVGIEVNVKGLVHPVGEIYPSRELLQCYLDACAAAGKGPIITVGTDAHYPEDLGIRLDDGARLLRSLGVLEIATFEEGVLIPFPLPDLED
ncbi:MAG: hypothetical protein JSW65_04715, partial [Candidatus Bipolaricaulota bacterium]